MKCLGLPTRAKVVPSAPPNLVIVNRPLNVGRGFLNVDQLVETLQVRRSLWLCLRAGLRGRHCC